MSIHIERERCVGCGACVEACPGNLIKRDVDGK
ncbi:MAG: ferredoxin family protein, partial [Thermoguttaceae bacterium]